MSYPRLYGALEDMVERGLLSTRVARSIVRKAGLPVGLETEVVESTTPPDLAGQYSKVQRVGGAEHSQYGTLVTHSAAALFGFPTNAVLLDHFGDFEGVSEMRFLVTVTLAGVASSTLEVAILEDTGSGTPQLTFTGGTPSVPLSSVGVHITDWMSPDWLSTTLTGVPAEVRFLIHNPAHLAGTVGVGLCQLQVR